MTKSRFRTFNYFYLFIGKRPIYRSNKRFTLLVFFFSCCFDKWWKTIVFHTPNIFTTFFVVVCVLQMNAEWNFIKLLCDQKTFSKFQFSLNLSFVIKTTNDSQAICVKRELKEKYFTSFSRSKIRRENKRIDFVMR